MSGRHGKKDFLYRTSEKIFERFIQNDKSGKRLSLQVKESLERLYPFEGKTKVKEYYAEKIRISLLLLTAGILVAVGLFASEFAEPVIEENRIRRQEYGGRARSIPVKVTIGGEKEYELDLKVGERIYGEEQLKELYRDALGELEKTVRGDNESLERVEKDLSLPAKIPGYPFHIEWESLNYDLIDGDGKLQNVEDLKQEQQAGLNAIFTYEDFRAEYLFYVQICPREFTEEEKEKRKLLETLEKSEEETREGEVMVLPAELDGKRLSWDSKKSGMWFGVLFGAVCTAGLVYFMKDEDLKKEVGERETQMRLAYPEIVSKLSLYLGAGVTVRRAWEKICADYENKGVSARKNHAYEEMRITCLEMKSGLPETEAYERFGKRCGIQLYGKFSALLTQNLRRGSTRLGPLLKEESKSAFEERKNAARKAGEEAGTKLLLPMMMMLCVVMLMILVPAFITF